MHILETTRTLLIVSHVTNKYWEDAISIALDFSIPLQALCIFLRYVTHNKGYRYHDPIGKCHYTTMDATFLEFESYYSLATILYLQRLTWNKDLKCRWIDRKVGNTRFEEELYMRIPLSYFVPSQHKLVIAFIIYVDDMIIICNDTKEIPKIQMWLSIEFEMKNLVGLKYFLGIEVVKSYEGIFISQRKNMQDLLYEMGMFDCKLVDIPMKKTTKLMKKVIKCQPIKSDIRD
ncbi:putative mitochondrial protein, partial [Mucuna pruriens]